MFGCILPRIILSYSISDVIAKQLHIIQIGIFFSNLRRSISCPSVILYPHKKSKTANKSDGRGVSKSHLSMTLLCFRYAVFYITTAPRPQSGDLTMQLNAPDRYGVTTPRTQNPLDSFLMLTGFAHFSNNYLT